MSCNVKMARNVNIRMLCGLLELKIPKFFNSSLIFLGLNVKERGEKYIYGAIVFRIVGTTSQVKITS
jgi:hypothetical protein